MKTVKQIYSRVKKEFDHISEDELLDLSKNLHKIQSIEKLNYNKEYDYEIGWEIYGDLFPEAFLSNDACYNEKGEIIKSNLRDYYYKFQLEFNNGSFEIIDEYDFGYDFKDALDKTELYIEEFKKEFNNLKSIKVYQVIDITSQREIKRKQIETLN